MRKKIRTIKEIKRYVKTHDTIEEILYCLVFFLAPFVFYLVAHFKYLFDYVDDEELQVYLEAEKRYSIATRIWLLAIIAILLVILIVKI
jgi:hypothetical protein